MIYFLMNIWSMWPLFVFFLSSPQNEVVDLKHINTETLSSIMCLQFSKKNCLVVNTSVHRRPESSSTKCSVQLQSNRCIQLLFFFSLAWERELLIMLLFSHKQNYSTKRKSSWLTKAGSNSILCQFCDGICSISLFPFLCSTTFTHIIVDFLALLTRYILHCKLYFYDLVSCDWQVLSLSPHFALSGTCSLVKLSQSWIHSCSTQHSIYHSAYKRRQRWNLSLSLSPCTMAGWSTLT